MRLLSLEPDMDEKFLEFLMRDVVSNFYTILDLKFSRERTKIWVAIDEDEFIGYMLEHDGRIIKIRGDDSCAAELLKMSALENPEFNVEPPHVKAVEKIYEPISPVGASRNKINTILAMEVDRKRFRPLDKHGAKKLGEGELDRLLKLYIKFYEEMALGPITREQIQVILNRSAKHGATYGIYRGDELVSFASGNRVLKDVANMAPVYTSPGSRSRGYATSACSALVGEFLTNNERMILFISENNIPALRVYGKIGFANTGHRFLTFWARKKPAT